MNRPDHITVLFSTTRKLASRFIRWVTRAPCSHAAICFWDETLQTRLVLQAEWWGFEVRPRARWDRENILIAEYGIPGVGLEAALRKSAAQLGSRYDYASAMWAGLSGWLRRWWRARLTIRPSRTPTKLMCSEAVIRFLKDAQVCGVDGFDEETTAPGDLLIFARDTRSFRRCLASG